MTTIQTVSQLEEMLSEPSEPVIEAMRRLKGDIILLGAAGKIGPSLARMARRASDLAGTQRRVLCVSRFSNPREEAALRSHGLETLRCDLLDEEAVARLPAMPNVIYLAGFKFGADQNPAAAWAANTWLPGVVCRRFTGSRIVAFSTGTVYGLAPVAGGGSLESDTPRPVGEYSMSCLGRERMFEHFSRARNIPTVLIRLFYAAELRYGVPVDLARKILAGEPIDLSMGWFNVLWQGDSNAITLQLLEHAAAPPFIINVTGPEVLRVREVAERMSRRLGRKPVFHGMESDTACLGNASQALHLFGPPRVTADQLIEWVADWVVVVGEHLGKPTHFETRDGRF